MKGRSWIGTEDAVVVWHDSIFLQAMEPAAKSGRFNFLYLDGALVARHAALARARKAFRQQADSQ